MSGRTQLPPFSLLIPVYWRDRPEQLARALTSSVEEQTVRPAEVVVVQDGPIGDELAAELSRILEALSVPARVEQLPRNEGVARALSHGVRACAYDVIARMDSDDVSLPDRFERQLELIADGYDLVGGGMFEFEGEGGRIVAQRTPPLGARIAEVAPFRDPFSHPTVVYRRDAVIAAGNYEDIGLMEDYWLFARMIAGGARVENVADPVLMYRVGDGAYHRRGGWSQLESEWRLQSAFRRIGFTSRSQWLRNIVVRGGYRLVPVGVRRLVYRAFLTRKAMPDASAPAE